jgi:hypothetical protein
MAIAEGALRDARHLLGGYSGRDCDGATFRRSAIEEHPQDFEFGQRQTEDVLIDILREGIVIIDARSRHEARAVVDRWLADDIALFRRLGLHGLGTVHATPEETITRILENELLFELPSRHELLEQLRRVAPNLEDETHLLLLQAVLAPKAPDDFTERNQYELLHWLAESGDERSDIAAHFRHIQDRNPDWIPREDEGMPLRLSGGFRHPQEPIDDVVFRAMLAKNADEALSKLVAVDYGPGWDHRPSWGDARAQLRNAVAATPATGTAAWRATDALPADERAVQLRAAILNGWAAATEPPPWTDVIEFIEVVPNFDGLEHDIARLLESAISGTARLPEASYADALAQSARLWRERIHDFGGAELGEDWLHRGRNDWPGILAGFWIYLASAARNAEADHGDLKTILAQLLQNAAEADQESLGGVKAVLGRELAFLNSAFEPLVTSSIFPTMSGTDTLARQYWDGFLYNPRIDLRMVRNGFADVAIAFAPAIGGLTQELRRQYLAVLVRLAGAPGIDGYDYFQSLLAKLSEPHRSELFAATRRYNERSDQSQREQLWTTWLGRTCHELSEGLPVSVSPADWTELNCIILGLTDSFHEAVRLATAHPAALNAHSPLYQMLTKSGQLESAPEKCQAILLHVLSGDVDPEWSDHLLEPIVHRLGRLLGHESAASLVRASIDAGFAHAGSWLEKFEAEPSLGTAPLSVDEEA